MVDLPLGKAIVAKEIKNMAVENRCNGCCLSQVVVYPDGGGKRTYCLGQGVACQYDKRRDGKNVIFKFVDLPQRKKKDTRRFIAIRERAKKLGVTGVRVYKDTPIVVLSCFEGMLDKIERDKKRANYKPGEMV